MFSETLCTSQFADNTSNYHLSVHYTNCALRIFNYIKYLILISNTYQYQCILINIDIVLYCTLRIKKQHHTE